MVITHHPQLEPATVRARYSDSARYRSTDEWHLFTATEIRSEIARSWCSLWNQPGHSILNAGAGGNDLGLCPPTTINLDISESRVAGLPNPIVGSVEALPLAAGTIDTLICVGSVVNYCDVALAISEFARVLRRGGHLILEFESSRSAELVKQAAFGCTAAVANTFYAGEREVVWVYDLRYVCNLLRAGGFKVTRTVPIHVLSPWVLLLTGNLKIAAITARLDRVLRYAPVLTRWASNYLLFCQKSA